MTYAMPEAAGHGSGFRRRDLHRLVNYLETQGITREEVKKGADENNFQGCSYGRDGKSKESACLFWVPVFGAAGVFIAEKIGSHFGAHGCTRVLNDVLGGLVGLTFSLTGVTNSMADGEIPGTGDEGFYNFLKEKYQDKIKDYKEIKDWP